MAIAAALGRIDLAQLEVGGAEPARRLHLPLTDEAKAECLALADDPQPAEPRASGWLGRMLADSGACFEVLRGAVLDGEQDEVDDPLLRAVFGRAPV